MNNTSGGGGGKGRGDAIHLFSRNLSNYAERFIDSERQRMEKLLNSPLMRQAQPSDEYRASWLCTEYNHQGAIDVYELEHVAPSLPDGEWKALLANFEIEFQARNRMWILVPHQYYLDRMPWIRYDQTCIVELVFSAVIVMLLLYFLTLLWS